MKVVTAGSSYLLLNGCPKGNKTQKTRRGFPGQNSGLKKGLVAVLGSVGLAQGCLMFSICCWRNLLFLGRTSLHRVIPRESSCTQEGESPSTSTSMGGGQRPSPSIWEQVRKGKFAVESHTGAALGQPSSVSLALAS